MMQQQAIHQGVVPKAKQLSVIGALNLIQTSIATICSMVCVVSPFPVCFPPSLHIQYYDSTT